MVWRGFVSSFSFPLYNGDDDKDEDDSGDDELT
jgi:hypothetical protein